MADDVTIAPGKECLSNPPDKAVEKSRLTIPTEPGIGAHIDPEAINPFRCFDFKADA